MKTILTSIVLSVTVLLGLVPVSQAGFIITSGSIDDPQSGTFTVVGYGSRTDIINKTNPFSPAVDFTANASIEGNLSTFNGSVVTLNSGSTGATYFSIGASLLAHDNSSVDATFGAIGNNIKASSMSTVNLNNVDVGGYVSASGGAMINVTGGSVGGDILASGTSNISGSDVLVGGNLSVSDSATLVISGGLIGGGILGADSSTIFISGGLFGGINGVLFTGSGSSVLNLYGTGLTLTQVGSSNTYNLAGYLQDGYSVEFQQIVLNDDAQVNLVNASAPEPSSLSLLAIGAAGMGGAALRRRSRKKQIRV